MVFLLSQQSDWLIDHRWGYYGEYVGSLKILHRLLSAGSQWLVCLAYTSSCFLLMMKIRFGNRILSWLGTVTLDFYLIHGLFVELFGYNFLGISGSLFYIKAGKSRNALQTENVASPRPGKTGTSRSIWKKPPSAYPDAGNHPAGFPGTVFLPGQLKRQ